MKATQTLLGGKKGCQASADSAFTDVSGGVAQTGRRGEHIIGLNWTQAPIKQTKIFRGGVHDLLCERLAVYRSTFFGTSGP